MILWLVLAASLSEESCLCLTPLVKQDSDSQARHNYTGRETTGRGNTHFTKFITSNMLQRFLLFQIIPLHTGSLGFISQLDWITELSWVVTTVTSSSSPHCDLVSPLLTSSDGVNMLTRRRVVKPGSELSVAQTMKIRLRWGAETEIEKKPWHFLRIINITEKWGKHKQ